MYREIKSATCAQDLAEATLFGRHKKGQSTNSAELCAATTVFERFPLLTILMHVPVETLERDYKPHPAQVCACTTLVPLPQRAYQITNTSAATAPRSTSRPLRP